MDYKLNKFYKVKDSKQCQYLMNMGHIPTNCYSDGKQLICVFKSENIIRDLQAYLNKTRPGVTLFLSGEHRKTRRV